MLRIEKIMAWLLIVSFSVVPILIEASLRLLAHNATTLEALFGTGALFGVALGLLGSSGWYIQSSDKKHGALVTNLSFLQVLAKVALLIAGTIFYTFTILSSNPKVPSGAVAFSERNVVAQYSIVFFLIVLLLGTINALTLEPQLQPKAGLYEWMMLFNVSVLPLFMIYFIGFVTLRPHENPALLLLGNGLILGAALAVAADGASLIIYAMGDAKTRTRVFVTSWLCLMLIFVASGVLAFIASEEVPPVVLPNIPTYTGESLDYDLLLYGSMAIFMLAAILSLTAKLGIDASSKVHQYTIGRIEPPARKLGQVKSLLQSLLSAAVILLTLGFISRWRNRY